MDEIVVGYLWTGQIVVGKLVEELTLKEPLEMIAGQNSTGQLNVHLTPYGSMFGVLPPITELDVESHLMFAPTEAPQHIVAEYVKATSKIVLPKSNVAPLRG